MSVHKIDEAYRLLGDAKDALMRGYVGLGSNITETDAVGWDERHTKLILRSSAAQALLALELILEELEACGDDND